MSRDSGTVRHHRRYVGLDVPVNVRPARWPTVAGLSWAAAALAAVLASAAAVLAALGRDVSIFLVPATLAYAWMGCVLLARRPGHPMGPLLCLIGLAVAFARCPLPTCGTPWCTRLVRCRSRPRMLWMNNVGVRASHQPGRPGPAAGLPGGKAAVAAVASRAVGGAGVHPAGYRRLRLHPAEHGPASSTTCPTRTPCPGSTGCSRPCAVLAVVCGLSPRRRGGGERDAALAPGRPGRRQQLKWFLAVLPFAITSLVATLVAPGPWSLA